jgi:TM2 domain-containing membrane protein YozV
MECKSCGAQIADNAPQCPYCQAAVARHAGAGAAQSMPATAQNSLGGPAASAENKVKAGICGILLGAFGIHKFVLGYNQAGVIMLCITVLSCGYLGVFPAILGLIEGIIYLTKSDQDFVNTYVVAKKEWL